MPTTGNSPDGNYVQYGSSINVGGDRNWRNNNPGNIEAGSFADSHGAIGSDGRFAIFPDAQTGMQALQSLLSSDTYQDLTIEEAMERYAPPAENDTDAYTSFIADNVGVDTSTPMSDLTAAQLTAFAEAIQTFEGGAAGTTYQSGDADAPSWVQDALNNTEPDSPDPAPDPIPSSPPDPEPDAPPDPIPSPLPGPTPEPLPAPSLDPAPDPSPGPIPDPGPDPDSGGGNESGDPGGGGEGGGGGGEGGGGGGGGGED